jgi:hypothetical protein
LIREHQMRVPLAVVAWALLGQSAWAGQPALELDGRLLGAVRAALAPALPYPESDALGSLPADGRSTAPWMVRPLDSASHIIEIVANPLNPDYQRRSAEAMAEIQRAIVRAERRAQAQYDRAVEELRRTGRSQHVDGVTLGDEGVAGAKIDAESRVTIDVAANQAAYRYAVGGSTAPAVSRAIVPSAVAVVTMPAHVYRPREGGEERFAPAEATVFFGAVSTPEIEQRSASEFEITATASAGAGSTQAVRSLVLRLIGSAALIDAILTQADWASLGAFVTP